MKNMKYLILSATALLALVSCRREEMYTPAEKEEGCEEHHEDYDCRSSFIIFYIISRR